MARFSGKVAIVTGGASGIGAAAARRFHQEGASVLIADLNDKAGTELAAALGAGRAIYCRVDVAVWEDVDAMVQAAVKAFGRLDILFNNAGIGSFAATPDLPLEEWRRVIDIDLNGVFTVAARRFRSCAGKAAARSSTRPPRQVWPATTASRPTTPRREPS